MSLPAPFLEKDILRSPSQRQEMNLKIIAQEDLQARFSWIAEIKNISGRFGDDSRRVFDELGSEIKANGLAPLMMHVRLCGAIPEEFGHDSSEEKLYSKYTDCVLSYAFQAIGLTSVVLEARGDSADVEAVCEDYSLVADAKAFRLSRTAKNQKDFKVQAIDGWRRDKDFAVIVAPSYQLPARASQIYQQAAARQVCLLSYAHLAALVHYAAKANKASAVRKFHNMLQVTAGMNPTKSAVAYWTAINNAMGPTDALFRDIWRYEKVASLESIAVAKEEALIILAQERSRIMRLTQDEAIRELMEKHRIDSREAVVRAVVDNGILGII